jgi:putative redox protein
MSFTATARRAGGALRHEVDVNGRHTIVTDEPASVGGGDAGPAPHELLPAALAACVATTIELYAERKGWTLASLSVHVVYDPEAQPRRFEVSVTLPAGLSPEQIARIEHIAGRCPVRRALEAEVVFDERVEVAAAR